MVSELVLSSGTPRVAVFSREMGRGALNRRAGCLQLLSGRGNRISRINIKRFGRYILVERYGHTGRVR